MRSVALVLLRFVAQYGSSCGVALESTGRKMTTQLENRIRETLEHFKLREDKASAAANGKCIEKSNNMEALLQQLLSAAQTQASLLAKLENSCLSNPGAGTRMALMPKMGLQLPDAPGAGHQEQEVTSHDAAQALEGALTALQQTKEELERVLRSSSQRNLPAGKTSNSFIC